jgi:large subunit ribosomal protein L13
VNSVRAGYCQASLEASGRGWEGEKHAWTIAGALFLWEPAKNSLTDRPEAIKYGVFCCEREKCMKSFMAKKDQVEQKWVLVDAEGAVLGRMAARIAPILMGKTKPTYTPHVDTGDYVIVVNADKVRVTGKKAETKEYDYYTHHPGGHKYVSFADMMARQPERVIQMAVRRMLPKNRLGRKMLKKLKVYRGPEHEHQAQRPQKIELF